MLRTLVPCLNFQEAVPPTCSSHSPVVWKKIRTAVYQDAASLDRPWLRAPRRRWTLEERRTVAAHGDSTLRFVAGALERESRTIAAYGVGQPGWDGRAAPSAVCSEYQVVYLASAIATIPSGLAIPAGSIPPFRPFHAVPNAGPPFSTPLLFLFSRVDANRTRTRALTLECTTPP